MLSENQLTGERKKEVHARAAGLNSSQGREPSLHVLRRKAGDELACAFDFLELLYCNKEGGGIQEKVAYSTGDAQKKPDSSRNYFPRVDHGSL